MRCSRCGAEVKDGDLFCINCGEKIQDEDATKIYVRDSGDTEESLEQELKEIERLRQEENKKFNAARETLLSELKKEREKLSEYQKAEAAKHAPKFCRMCGCKVEDESFCPQCGQKIK